jgi:isochorismate pyruvate lyase
MIRPLEYCENTAQIASSIDTIDARILELLHLRKQYVAEKQRILGNNETDLINLSVVNEDIQQLIENNQLLQNEQK